MKLARILLPINHRGTTCACVRAAFSLAAQSGAQLEVVHAIWPAFDRVPYSTELSALNLDELLETVRQQIEREKQHAQKWLSVIADKFPQVHADLVEIEDMIAPAISLKARMADLTVLPPIRHPEDLFWSGARDAALFNSGRPILVVPTEIEARIGETVVIAWKNTVEAVRAIVAAFPFLAEAKWVRLVSLGEDVENKTADAMFDYLKRMGLDVELASERAENSRDIGPTLLQLASGRGVLLVMGAYGHWRWREWAFGGVTQYVLSNATTPVLLMH